MSTVTSLRAPRLERPTQTRRPDIHARRLRAAVLAGALALALAVAVSIVLLGGSGPAPPATGAAALVPSGALAYVNVSTDTSRPAVGSAGAIATRLPGLGATGRSLSDRLATLVGGGAWNATPAAIRPWLGNEASLALLASGATASPAPLAVLAVDRPARASAFVKSAGATAAGSYDRTALLRYADGTEVAFTGQYLIAGAAPAVQASLDAATHRAPSLEQNAGYRRASADEPPARALDAYVSAAGINEVLAPLGRTGALLAALLSRPALLGTAISLTPSTAGLGVYVHSALTRTHAGAPEVSPTLPKLVPKGSAFMLDLAGLARSLPGLLATAADAGVAGRLGPLLDRLGIALSAEGVNLGQLRSIFNGESAVALAPTGNVQVSTAAPATPSLLILVRPPQPALAQQELASLEVPLSRLFPPPGAGPGQAPEIADQQLAGVTIHELSLAPGLQLDWATFRGLVAIATNPASIAAVAAHKASVADEPLYHRTVATGPAPVTSLLFADFTQLLRIGEETGLIRGMRTGAALDELERIRAVSLRSTSAETDTTAELFLQIS